MVEKQKNNGIKLNPCPFCGGEAIFKVSGAFSSNHCAGFSFFVGCGDCGVVLSEKFEIDLIMDDNGKIVSTADEREKAAELWNRRA